MEIHPVVELWRLLAATTGLSLYITFNEDSGMQTGKGRSIEPPPIPHIH